MITTGEWDSEANFEPEYQERGNKIKTCKKKRTRRGEGVGMHAARKRMGLVDGGTQSEWVRVEAAVWLGMERSRKGASGGVRYSQWKEKDTGRKAGH